MMPVAHLYLTVIYHQNEICVSREKHDKKDTTIACIVCRHVLGGGGGGGAGGGYSGPGQKHILDNTIPGSPNNSKRILVPKPFIQNYTFHFWIASLSFY